MIRAWVIGYAGIYRSLTTGAAAVWARLGFYGFLIGIALATAWVGVGLGVAGVLEELGTSAEAVALWELFGGLLSMTVIPVPLAFAFLGMGMVWGTIHSRWLGWSLLGLGVLGAILGIVQVVTGPSALLQVLRGGVFGLISLWALVFGIWLWRKAW